MLKRKTLPIIALTFMSSVAAADWQMVGGNGKEFSMFVDLDLARRNGSIVTMPQLVTFGDLQPPKSAPTEQSAGKPYLSEKSQVEFDCAGKRTRVVATEHYAGERASGNVVHRNTSTNAEWMPVPMSSNIEVAWRLACERR